MKPSSVQLADLRDRIAAACCEKGLSDAEIGRITRVHPSQVGRIRGGEFKTFSHNVVQVCRALDVPVPRPEPGRMPPDPAWAEVEGSIRRIWDETPEGAHAIRRMIDAVADLAGAARPAGHLREGAADRADVAG